MAERLIWANYIAYYEINIFQEMVISKDSLKENVLNLWVKTIFV